MTRYYAAFLGIRSDMGLRNLVYSTRDSRVLFTVHVAKTTNCEITVYSPSLKTDSCILFTVHVMTTICQVLFTEHA